MQLKTKGPIHIRNSLLYEKCHFLPPEENVARVLEGPTWRVGYPSLGMERRKILFPSARHLEEGFLCLVCSCFWDLHYESTISPPSFEVLEPKLTFVPNWTQDRTTIDCSRHNCKGGFCICFGFGVGSSIMINHHPIPNQGGSFGFLGQNPLSHQNKRQNRPNNSATTAGRHHSSGMTGLPMSQRHVPRQIRVGSQLTVQLPK